MRECIVPAWILLSCLYAQAQIAPQGWKVLRDAKGACQIAVPPEWSPFGDSGGAAVLRDAGTAIAVVTAQPGQTFGPLPANIVKIMAIPKDKFFENSSKRIFYQDKISKNPDDPNAFSSSVPAKSGTCSCHVVLKPEIADEIGRKIALSLAPGPEEPPQP